jgi:hypothetical protein
MGLRDSIQEMALPLRDKLKKVLAHILSRKNRSKPFPGEAARDAIQRPRGGRDRRILLLELGMRVSTVKCVLAEVSRETKLGPCRGVLYPIGVFGTDLHVFRRFFRDVAEADRVAGF